LQPVAEKTYIARGKKQEMEMSYGLTGEIKVVQEAKTFGARGFAKRELVVTVKEGRYPQDIALEFVQDKA